MNSEIYKNLLENIKKVEESESKRKTRDSELWKYIKELSTDDFPDELPSDCLMIVSVLFYDTIKLKLGDIPPNFIKKSEILEQNNIILMKNPQSYDTFSIRTPLTI